MKNSTAIRNICFAICVLVLSACGGGGGSGSAPADRASISITITSPAAADIMETSDPSVVLEGTASGPGALESIRWVNDRGGSGTASGTSSWTTGAIALQQGLNRITITATGAAGATGSRTISITRESADTGSATLSWTPPTAREDGSPLTNLAGFRVHYGRMSGIYDYAVEIDNPGVTTYVIEGLSPGEWYFVVSAYDAAGIESNFSNEGKRTVP